MDAQRAGPFMLTVYMAGKAYAFLGDLALEATGSNEFGETAGWRAEKSPWAFQGSVGLRFRWLPD